MISTMSKDDDINQSTGNVFADLDLPDAEEALARADIASRIVSVDELDAEDIKAALEELRQGKTIPWEQVKKDLDL